jgi:hypothetical protein
MLIGLIKPPTNGKIVVLLHSTATHNKQLDTQELGVMNPQIGSFSHLRLLNGKLSELNCAFCSAIVSFSASFDDFPDRFVAR